MRPVFQRLTKEPEEGFLFLGVRNPGFNCPWEVHPEHELILVLRGHGYRIVGDNVASVGPGDMVFVAAGLPHLWHEERAKGAQAGEALVIQFAEGFLGEGLLKLPALEPVRRFLRNAERGLQIMGPTCKRIRLLMKKMDRSKGLDRIVQFLQVLNCLADSKDCHPIASPDFVANRQLYDQERMDRVFQFLTSHLERDIRLREAAKLANLSDSAFSRFFRGHTGKTFPQFVNELRIGRACRLLTEGEKNITEVAFECGFSNLSNFNRQFHRLKGVSPREFRCQVQGWLLGHKGARGQKRP